MSALDAAFFTSERNDAPLHIASVTVLEGPRPSFAELRALIAAKLHLNPRYRQRVRPVPLWLGHPVWTDDTRFDLDYHLRHTAVPPPGRAGELRDTASRILTRRLDLTRSPWQLWMVEGLDEGRWAIIAKVHHCMVDGVGAVDLLASLLDVPTPHLPSAKDSGPTAEAWQPRPEPSTARLLGEAIRDDVSAPFHELAGAFHRPQGLRTALAFAAGLPSTLAELLLPPALPWHGSQGRYRRWAFTSADLSEIKTIRGAHGGTVNDVMVAAVSSGFRSVLGEQLDEEEARVRSMIPVSVRAAPERGALTNRVSAVFVDLPCHEPDPLRRLFLVRKQMDALKRTAQERGGEVLVRLSGLAPMLLPAISRAGLAFATPHVTTVTTNVPGPQFPLYLLGRKVVAIYPYVPTAAGIRASIGIFSYLGRLCVGVTTAGDIIDRSEALSEGIRAGLDELLELSQPFHLADAAPPTTPRSPTKVPS